MKHSNVLDTSRAAPAAVRFLASYFAAKSSHDLAGTVEHFSPQTATYTDAVLGMAEDGYDGVKSAFEKSMPHYGEELSYPDLIMGGFPGGNGSALVAFTDTPEIVGSELRILAPVDVRDGKIVRWVDYWDSTAFEDVLYNKLRATPERFPTEYKETSVGVSASRAVTDIANRLHAAIAAGDSAAAAALFDDDAVVEDMSLRVQVIGKTAVTRYFGRTLAAAPLGAGSRLRHLVGGELGGGFFNAPAWRVAKAATIADLQGWAPITMLQVEYGPLQQTPERELASWPTRRWLAAY